MNQRQIWKKRTGVACKVTAGEEIVADLLAMDFTYRGIIEEKIKQLWETCRAEKDDAAIMVQFGNTKIVLYCIRKKCHFLIKSLESFAEGITDAANKEREKVAGA